MKTFLALVAVAAATLTLASPAAAQFYPGGGVQHGFTPGYGMSINTQAGLGYGQIPAGTIWPGTTNYGFGGYNYGYRQPHVDFFPTQVVPHRGHFHVQPAHTDLHIGGRYYQAVPGPFGTVQVSPFPHRHR